MRARSGRIAASGIRRRVAIGYDKQTGWRGQWLAQRGVAQIFLVNRVLRSPAKFPLPMSWSAPMFLLWLPPVMQEVSSAMGM